MSTAAPHKTAIQRWSLSRPVALALEHRLLSTKTTFFHYPCGRGRELRRLHQLGVPVSGWAPAFFPDEDRTPADEVNLGYVVNVIEDLEERPVALRPAWEVAHKLLIVSARLARDTRTVTADYQGDGIVTCNRTFQKFFARDKLRAWIQSTTRRSCVAAAPEGCARQLAGTIDGVIANLRRWTELSPPGGLAPRPPRRVDTTGWVRSVIMSHLAVFRRLNSADGLLGFYTKDTNPSLPS